jgi:4-hydroxy-tetrahydrodipicolinate synthase
VERVGWLSELPIDGLLLVTPAYNRPPQEGLYQHFAAAAAAARKPLLLYNVPARTAVDMKPATVARLARLKGIVGIKEALPETERVRELVAVCPADFVVLSGDDATARLSIAAGARVKWLLAQLGLIGSGLRLPLTPLAAEHHAGLLAAARSAGLLAG